MSYVDPDLRIVLPLSGTSLAIVVTAITCGVVSIPVVALRSFFRFQDSLFGWDDGLMLCGQVVFVVEVVLAVFAAYAGLGALDNKLNDYLLIQSKKYLMIWMMLYVVSLVLIKSSICMTMLRIGSPLKTLRVCVYILLSLVVGTFVATFTGILLLCKPVEANWNTGLVLEGRAKCASMDTMVGLSYFSTASSIATDLACATLPGVLVWNMQLKRNAKIGVCILLSFGSLACISTIVRTPYIRFYLDPTSNLVYHVGNIILWSNIETSIGLIAGSIPTLRRLFMRNINNTTGYSAGGLPAVGGSGGNELVTIGGGGRRTKKSFKNPTDLGVSVVSVVRDGDWRRLGDGSQSDQEHQIRRNQSYKVEIEVSDKSVGASSRESIIKRGR